MPGPLLLAPLAAKAAPWVLGVVGSMLPVIVDAFRTGKSPEEAAKIVEPKRQEIIDRLVGTGMNRSAAGVMADESIKGELEKAKLPDPMNPWLSAALSIGGLAAGAYGGAKLGGMMKGKTKVEQPVTANGEVKSLAAPSDKPAPTAKLTAPNEPVMKNADVISVESSPFPGEAKSAAQYPELFASEARSYTIDSPFPSPEIRGRGFVMRDPSQFMIGMTPETGRNLDIARMRKRMTSVEGD